MGSSSSRPPGEGASFAARAQQQLSAAGQAVRENVTMENATAASKAAADTTAKAAAWASWLSQSLASNPNAMQAAAAQQAKTGGGVYGGCGCPGGYFGGALDEDPARGLREYEESYSAKAKESVIRRLGRALNEAGLKITDPDTADLDTIVAELVAQIPNPRKGSTFSKQAADHEKVCRLVAKALNSQFSAGATKPSEMMIDTTLGPEGVCRQVGEWVHSFASGVNTEFLETHTSIRNAMHNVRLMDEVMQSAYKQIRNRVESGECGPEEQAKLAVLTDLYERAQAERQRMEETLNNILHLQLGPVAKELEIAMRDESERNALIRKLDLKPGTGEFADTLASAISGLGTAAAIAHRVNRALKTVGASVDEYLRATDEGFLRRLDDSLLDRKSDESWTKIVTAMTTLRDAFSRRKDKQFAEALREEAGKTGGAATIDARVKRQQAEKEALIADFTRRLSAAYNEFIASLAALAPELGKSIPLGPDSDALREAISRLSQKETHSRLELALIGYYSDAAAREKKETFLASLRHVVDACSVLAASEAARGGAAALTRVQHAVEAIEKLIDRFTSMTAKFFGGAEGDSEIVGGDSAADLIPRLAQSGESLAEAAGSFAYFYYIAKVRENFRRAASEVGEFGAKYEAILGDAVAGRIQQLDDARKKVVEVINDDTKVWTAFPDVPVADRAGWKTAATEWVTQEFKAKMNFYRALEAIDLYLKAFTAGIVSDPGAVSNIQQQLQGVKVIARWFNEQAGDAVWRAFECMRSINTADPLTAYRRAADDNTVGSTARTAGGNAHYYAKLEAAKGGNKLLVGLPGLGVNPVGADNTAQIAAKEVATAYDNFQALKNLLSAFMQIGVVFGDKDIRRQVFMSPSQLFKSLMDYLKRSALSINAVSFDAAGVAPFRWAAPPSLPEVSGEQISLPGIPTPGGAPPIPAPPARHNLGGLPRFGTPGGYVFFGSVDDATSGNFAEEDRYFAMAVKAIAGKILTALGVYDMFDRRTPLYDLTPTRAVLGGALAPPEALVDATELYWRLPRLVEFYRCLRWDGKATAGIGDAARIALVPDIEGTFSGLIRTIFVRIANPEQGDYTESELHDVIREVNSIWTHFHAKDGARASETAVDALVAEVNRRLGFYKSEEMTQYWSLLQRAASPEDKDPWKRASNTDYAILPGEGELEAERQAPSDRYVHGIAALADKKVDRSGLDDRVSANTSRRGMLRRLMNQVMNDFGELDANRVGRESYALMLKQAKTRMQSAQTATARLAIAMELVQGTERASTEQAKAFFFNETVVVGLNTLSAIERFITLFEAELKDLSLDRKMRFLVDRLQSMAFLGAGAFPTNDELAVLAPLPAAAPNPDPVKPKTTRTNPRYLLPRPTAFVAGTGDNPFYGGRAGTNVGVRLSDVRAFALAGAVNVNAEIAGGGPHVLGRRWASELLSDANAISALSADQRAYLQELRLAARLLIDTDLMMADFIEALFALHHSSGGLIEVKLTASGGVLLGFARMRELVESIMGDVKRYFELFRPHLPPDVAASYESSDRPGSIYWLEAQLIDRRFRGSLSVEESPKWTMDGISRRASEVLRQLRSSVGVAANPDTAPADWAGPAFANREAVRRAVPDDPNLSESYGRALSQLVFYDAGLANSGLAPEIDELTAMDALGDLIRTGRPTDARPARPVIVGGVQRLRLYDTKTPSVGMGPFRSLVGAFNQLFARYLAVLSDASSSRKIYSGLVLPYANGPGAKSVAEPNGNSLPDLSRLDFGQRGDPESNTILFQSLAYMLQRITTDVAPQTQVPDHLVQTLADVPAYLKEGYRANLPAFVRLFDLVVQKGEFIKQFAQKTNLDCGRPNQQSTSQIWTPGAWANGTKIRVNAVSVVDGDNRYTVGATAATGALKALRVLDAGKTSEAMMATITDIIDSVSAAASTLATSAGEVLKELGDRPVFFETYDGSIDAYRARQGKMPLMPLSLAAHVLRDLDERTEPAIGGGPARNVIDDTTLFPRYNRGEASFKFQYGVRGVLARYGPITFDQLPGVKASLDDYNGVSPARDRLDPQQLLGYDQKVVDLLRYLTENRQYKMSISTQNTATSPPFNGAWLTRHVAPGPIARNRWYPLGTEGVPDNDMPKSGLIPPANGDPPAGGDYGTETYTLTIPTQRVAAIAETTDQEGAVAKIARYALRGKGATSAGTGRSQERLLNIIDLNIVPINPSAFMRDIPLANLYNYEYAFERAAAAMYGESAQDYTDPNSADFRDADHIHSVRQLFVALLCDPYLQLDKGRPSKFALYPVGDGIPDEAAATSSATKAVRLYGSNVLDLGSSGWMHRIFRGDNDLGLGRPKFLSDQLFNKALLGSLYPSREDVDVAGPGVGAGVARGRAAVNESWRTVNEAVRHLRGLYTELVLTAQSAIVDLTTALAGGVAPASFVAALDAYVLAIGGGATVAALAGTFAPRPVYATTRDRLAELTGRLIPYYKLLARELGDNLLLATAPADRAKVTTLANAITAVVPADAATALAAMNIAANPDNTWNLSAISRAAAVIKAGVALPAGADPVQTVLRIVAFFLGITPSTGVAVRPVESLAGSAQWFASLSTGIANVNDVAAIGDLPAGATGTVWMRPGRPNVLTYVATDAKSASAVEEVPLTPDEAVCLEQIGRARFDTRFVRNLYFMTSVLRVVRLKLNRELTQSRKVVVASHLSVAPGVTEYGIDPFTPNETFPSVWSQSGTTAVPKYSDEDDAF